jgi:ABC-type branched-subunit amino acid transport system substrate-binding protein
MNKKILYGFGALIILIGGAYMYVHKEGVTSVGAIVEQKQVIKLGVMLPLTSQFGTIAEGVGKAAQMAVADFEEQNPNVDVVTIQDDDKFDPKTGVGIYIKMTTLDQIDGLFMVSTPIIDAAHEKMKEDGLPVVSVGLQNYGVGKDNIFQMSADANGQIVNLAKFMNEKSNHTKTALVHSSNAPALVGFYEAFTGAYTKEYTDFIINSKDDAKTVAAKIASFGPDAVVVLTDPNNGSALTKELLVLGVTPDQVQYYYDAQLQTGWGEYEKLIGDMNKMNGTLVLQFTTSDLTEFQKRYQELYGTDPSPFAEYGYDGIMTLLNNYDADKAAWVEKIAVTNFKGYSGNVDFDERGIRNQGTEVWKVADGKVVKN